MPNELWYWLSVGFGMVSIVIGVLAEAREAAHSRQQFKKPKVHE